MSNGPLPSTLTLLENLGSFPVRSKVRFLACVDAYYPRTATLLLSHHSLFPPAHAANTKAVLLDISLHVASLPSGLTANGEWLNVIGYIVEPPEDIPHGEDVVHVQAIQMWSAGNIDLGAYELSLRERLKADKDTQQLPSIRAER